MPRRLALAAAALTIFNLAVILRRPAVIAGCSSVRRLRARCLRAPRQPYCKSQQECEIDHLISLELGGANDEKNLWPELYQGEILNAYVKGQLENLASQCGVHRSDGTAGRPTGNFAQLDWSYEKHMGDPTALSRREKIRRR